MHIFRQVVYLLFHIFSNSWFILHTNLLYDIYNMLPMFTENRILSTFDTSLCITN